MKNIKLTNSLLILAFIVSLFVLAKSILIPLILGGFLAMLVYPIQRFLKSKGINNIVALSVAVSSILVFIVVLSGMLSWQVAQISNDTGKIKKQFNTKKSQVTTYLKDTYNLKDDRLEKFSKNTKQELKSTGKKFLGTFSTTMGSGLLVVLYIILFLMLKDRIKNFIFMVTDEEKVKENDILTKSAEIVRNFFVGKFLVMAILAVTYGIGFSLVGIQYAPMLALLAAILTIIPYLGNLLGAGLVFIFILISGGGIKDIALVVGIMSFTQFLESYILMPKVVGEKVNLNALTVIFGVIFFGLIWGVMGTIMALPILGIIKEWFGHYEDTKPYAYLMGTEEADEIGS